MGTTTNIHYSLNSGWLKGVFKDSHNHISQSKAKGIGEKVYDFVKSIFASVKSFFSELSLKSSKKPRTKSYTLSEMGPLLSYPSMKKQEPSTRFLGEWVFVEKKD